MNISSFLCLVSLENQRLSPHLQLVCYKEHSLVFSSPPNCFIEDVGTHTRINSTERVIQKQYGPLTVECTCQAHSLTLSSAKISAPLPNLEGKSKDKCF